MSKNIKLMGLLVGLVMYGLSLSMAHASIIQYSGDTTGEPTWNRPSAFDALSVVGTDVPYQVQQFSVTTSGAYSMEVIAGSFDSYLHLYVGSFNPLDQLTNLLALDDDDGAGLFSLIVEPLIAGTQYFLVTTGFSNTNYGTYTNEISGQGNIVLGQAQIPEPHMLALMGLGLAGLGFARRKSV